MSGDGTAWYLINAAPDVRAGILDTPELAPGPGLRDTPELASGPGLRDTPLRGVLLTTAELDHTLGLLSLREAIRLRIYATATVTMALTSVFPVFPTLAQYTGIDVHEVSDGIALDGGLDVQRLTVGTKRPRYARADLSEEGLAEGGSPKVGGSGPKVGESGDGRGLGSCGRGDWVSALRLTDRATKKSLVYATCLPEWTEDFDAFVDGADEVLLDGTFGTEDELTLMTGRPGTARSMGHLPMSVSREHAGRHPGTRFRFSHLNNTNPAVGDDIVADGDLL
ncbi:coenzyme PQQ synthesis protein B [Actinoplanes sp. L3-i22]|nr:coenzyme PQQ synthesis protein B [Actinoplanes sp. L3-i22]